jgi:acyl-CoA thioesterase-1
MLKKLQFIMLAHALAAIGCDGGNSGAPDVTPAAATTASADPAASTQAVARAPRIVFLGDSLTAGAGVETNEAFPALIGRQLSKEGIGATVVNAGVSGDTTAGGLRRLSWVLRQRPDVLVVCLGGNDGLRLLDVDAAMANLRQIIEKAQSAGADVLLLGMLLPTNYGPEYRERFAAIYPTLAKEFNVPLVPFALEGVGGVPAMNQPDGIHPTAKGHGVVASNVIGPLRELVRARAARTPAG